jgi:hypothetical protein
MYILIHLSFTIATAAHRGLKLKKNVHLTHSDTEPFSKKSFSKPTLTFTPTQATLINIHANQAKPFSLPRSTQANILIK